MPLTAYERENDMFNCNCCDPTYLVTTVSQSETNVLLGFRTTPTLVNGCKIKFRIACNIATSVTAGLPVVAVVNINGETVSIPLLDSIGNNVRSGELRARNTYTAVFGNDPNHLQIKKVNGKPCTAQ